jgi:hypothetical protein
MFGSRAFQVDRAVNRIREVDQKQVIAAALEA